MLSICGCLLSSCSLDLQPENGLTYSNSFNTEKELNDVIFYKYGDLHVTFKVLDIS